MATAILYEGDLTTVRYTFYQIGELPNWGIKGEGIAPNPLPGLLDPWFFDSKSRTEDFFFNYTTIPSTYQSGNTNMGTGTFLDQLADVFYLFRHQGGIIRGDSDLGEGGFPTDARHWWFQIAFHSTAAVDASHDVGLAAETGFVAGDSTYLIPCIIKDIKVLDVSPVQQHASLQISLQRAYTVIGI